MIHALSNVYSENRNRILPMEGLRGVAVGLVFLQHYCMQFALVGDLSGGSKIVAEALGEFGNYGVELFFVLSGFLIYDIILQKRPAFMLFMFRRAQRLYPAFLVALLIGISADQFRSPPKIPAGILDAAAYIFANLAFLPGLFPIDPLFAVNWSLSYEWWFYISCALLVTAIDLKEIKQAYRIVGIVTIGALLVALSAASVPGVPIRGLSFLSGLLLVESRASLKKPIPASVVAAAVLAAFLFCVGFRTAIWISDVVLASSFFILCQSSFQGKNLLARVLSLPGLRALGNMSYSFYLLHAFAVVPAVRAIVRYAPPMYGNYLFWVFLPIVFAAAFFTSAILFFSVEKPFSLTPTKRKASTKQHYPQQHPHHELPIQAASPARNESPQKAKSPAN